MGIGAWENTKPARVAIGIPHTGLCFVEWAISLRILHLPQDTNILYAHGLPIDYARNCLVDQAVKANVDYLFFLDSDVLPPTNAITQLLNDNLPIVTGIYRNKVDNLPAVWRKAYQDDKPGYLPVPVSELTTGKPLIEADVVGMGCCLIKMEVFKKIEYPWFDWTVDMERKTGRGEDFYFCEKAKAAGYKTMADTRVLCSHEVLGVLKGDFTPMKKCEI